MSAHVHLAPFADLAGALSSSGQRELGDSLGIADDPPSPPASHRSTPAEPSNSGENPSPGTPAGCAAAGRSGLVISEETSDTRHRAYRGENRIRRMRRAIPEAVRSVTLDAQIGGIRTRAAFVTLTYRDGAEWSPRHVSELQKRYAHWLARRGHRLRSVWVLELTKAGVPHYHLIMMLPRGLTPPKPDKQGWWPHGLTRVEWARNATGYLAKYASKGQADFAFPRGARLYGVRGLGRLRPSFRHHMRPRWQRRAFTASDTLRRVPGGYWCHAETGELLQSPYELVARCPRWTWVEFRLRQDSCRKDQVPAVTPG
jgi:hypothetical protein